MPALRVLAAVTPDNTPHGGDLTFAIPIGFFAVVIIALLLLFLRPHQRVPGRRGVLPAQGLAPPGRPEARAAAVAGGLSAAPGGGSAESPLEPAGHVYEDGGPADDAAGDEADAGPGASAGPPDGNGPVPDDGAEDRP